MYRKYIVKYVIHRVQNNSKLVQIYWQTYILFQLTLFCVNCKVFLQDKNCAQNSTENNCIQSHYVLYVQEWVPLFVSIMNHIRLFVFCVFTKPILWVILLPSELNPISQPDHGIYNGALCAKKPSYRAVQTKSVVKDFGVLNLITDQDIHLQVFFHLIEVFQCQ